MNAYVEYLFETYLTSILEGDGICVPDDPEEMDWRIFFAHSQDMQGFRADIFTGGPNEAKHPTDDNFVGLRERWGGDNLSLIGDLASLWEDDATRAALTRMSNPFKPDVEKAKGIRPALNLLRASGVRGAVVFADTLDDFHGPKIARKTNAMIRAYVQNAHLVTKHGGYRDYLRSITPGPTFPPTDVRAAEPVWHDRLQRDFYGVGPALAPYMVCDWLLWLWRAGRVEWFTAYKPDSVHERAVKEGCLPEAARHDFVGYCATLRIPPGHGAASGKPCPPRVLNECIWLGLNRSSGPK